MTYGTQMERRQQQADASWAGRERIEAEARCVGDWPKPIKETPTVAEQDRWLWCEYLTREKTKRDEDNLS
jgi:hypothetical protein